MKDLPKDIIKEIEARFALDAHKAIYLITEFVERLEYIQSNRVIRCVLYLSNDLKSLRENLNYAKLDPRDVMFWAEYDMSDTSNHRRIHDFTKPFPDYSI